MNQDILYIEVHKLIDGKVQIIFEDTQIHIDRLTERVKNIPKKIRIRIVKNKKIYWEVIYIKRDASLTLEDYLNKAISYKL